MSTLTAVTNSTGYVAFQNATAGTYTFTIVKEGYPTQNETLDYNAQPLTLNIELLNNTKSNTNNSDETLIVVVAVVIIAVAVALIAGLFIVKRRKSPNLKKLQELKKQMKPKFET